MGMLREGQFIGGPRDGQCYSLGGPREIPAPYLSEAGEPVPAQVGDQLFDPADPFSKPDPTPLRATQIYRAMVREYRGPNGTTAYESVYVHSTIYTHWVHTQREQQA